MEKCTHEFLISLVSGLVSGLVSSFLVSIFISQRKTKQKLNLLYIFCLKSKCCSTQPTVINGKFDMFEQINNDIRNFITEIQKISNNDNSIKKCNKLNEFINLFDDYKYYYIDLIDKTNYYQKDIKELNIKYENLKKSVKY